MKESRRERERKDREEQETCKEEKKKMEKVAGEKGTETKRGGAGMGRREIVQMGVECEEKKDSEKKK